MSQQCERWAATTTYFVYVRLMLKRYFCYPNHCPFDHFEIEIGKPQGSISRIGLLKFKRYPTLCFSERTWNVWHPSHSQSRRYWHGGILNVFCKCLRFLCVSENEADLPWIKSSISSSYSGQMNVLACVLAVTPTTPHIQQRGVQCKEDHLSGQTTSCSYYERFMRTFPQKAATITVKGTACQFYWVILWKTS